jgi:hypothetical protein
MGHIVAQVPKATKAETDKLNAAMESSAKYLASLKELTPNALWRSCVRQSEVDRRLARESNIIEAITEASSSNLANESCH